MKSLNKLYDTQINKVFALIEQHSNAKSQGERLALEGQLQEAQAKAIEIDMHRNMAVKTIHQMLEQNTYES